MAPYYLTTVRRTLFLSTNMAGFKNESLNRVQRSEGSRPHCQRREHRPKERFSQAARGDFLNFFCLRERKRRRCESIQCPSYPFPLKPAGESLPSPFLLLGRHE